MQDKYDPAVPAKLKSTQQWFASIITRPILDGSKMLPLSPSGIPMEQEARQLIAPSAKLLPHQRIEIYNQQYWWRLLSTMHEIYPLVTRLFGYYQFNQTIAIPYLVKYPPNHWSLNFLGSHLAQWVEENYDAKDKKLVLDSAKLDWVFNDSFFTEQKPQIDLQNLPVPGDASCLLNIPLYLQPYVTLFKFDYDLPAFREIFIKEDGDHWIEQDFPKLVKGNYHFVISRTHNNNIAWFEVSEGEFFLLNLLQKGISIEDACEALEHADDKIAEEAMTNLHKWFQEWVIRHWLTLQK